MTAPRDIPGASASASTSRPATTNRIRANTFSYPRWDADGNSHHPPPDTASAASPRTLSQSARTTAAGLAMSPAASDGTPALSASSSSSILRMLGLSPKGSSTVAPFASRDEDSDQRAASTSGQAGLHRRGASYSGQPSSFAHSYSPGMASLSSPFYEDDEDGPPEAVTPPQQQFSISMPPTREDKPDTQSKLTNYGHELDEAHKLELDDVFDGAATIPMVKSPPLPPSGIYGAPLGRRASWSPAVKPSIAASAGHAYSSSPPGGPPPGVINWLHGQQTTYPISPTHSEAAATKIPATTSPTTTSDCKDFGSSPVGLFRRLSLSVNRRPPPPAPPSTVSEVSDLNDKERIGRPLARVTSAPPRRLSPMGERMLRAHYDSFS